ncbi:MAG TPA: PilZ domain-containing protein [Limnochordia bacterium]
MPRAGKPGAAYHHVDTRAVLESIAYQKGFLFAAAGAKDIENVPVQVVKHERGHVLLRVELAGLELPERALIEVHVPLRAALIRVGGRLANETQTKDGARILIVRVEEVGAVQRRLKERYPLSCPVVFRPLRAGPFVLSVTENRFGVGRTVDLSLGGMQMISPLRLVKDLVAHFEVRMPQGVIEAEGKVVTVRDRLPAGTPHGIRFVRLSGPSRQLLARTLLDLERRERAQDKGWQSVGMGGRRRPGGDGEREPAWRVPRRR